MDFLEIVNSNIPFVQAELVKSSLANGTIEQEYIDLVIGQKTAAGTAIVNTPIQIFSHSEAQAKFGKTSMLAAAAKRFFDNNKGVAIKFIPLDDEASGIVATGTITITGTATENGTFSAYINGSAFRIATAIGDSASDIATLLAAKINAVETSQVIATALTGIVTLTSVHKGTYGNTIKTMMNYNDDDLTPSGLTITIVQMNGGAGDPDLSALGIISHLEETQYNMVVCPYTDNATLTLIDTALTDNFKATDMLDGFCLVGVNDTVVNLTTKTAILNSAFITVLDNGSVFATGLEQAATTMGVISDIAQSSPGSSYLNKELSGILPLSQRIRTERNALAGGGVATLKVVGTTTLLERTVTTLQKDENSISLDVDDTDLRLFLTLSYVRYTFIVYMSRFQGYKLGNDDDRFGAGVRIMTPNLYKQNLVINYSGLVTRGICEDLATFIDKCIVEKDGNRLNSQMEINTINVLLQQAMQLNYQN